ncbi:glyoxalase [Virgibacillus phasianinus]|uniref:Glyoxalase n=2 Tax=Virgibacillus phasianinus TaxID=2017483 RepID=A0A220TYH4_9BACI|nr:glyoxalase [Virgibacillus phasianinus]
MEQKFFREPSTFVGHVELNITNLASSLEFYQEVIGLQILEQSERRAVLTADGKTGLISLVQPEQAAPKQANTTGLYHYAILLPNRVDLAKVIQHFSELNIRIGASDHLVSEALYLNDPDGNGIEIYVDRPSSTWTWKNSEVAMTVDPLDIKDIMGDLGNESWEGLPAGTVIGHIHLHVSELKNTEEFYREGLGFDVVNRFGAQALFISTGGYHHHIGLNTWAGAGAPAPAENSAGLAFFALTLPSEGAREKVIDRLQGLGYDVERDDEVFMTKDPSGNRIKLQV